MNTVIDNPKMLVPEYRFQKNEILMKFGKTPESAEFIARTLKKMAPKYNFISRTEDQRAFLMKVSRSKEEDLQYFKECHSVYCTGYDEEYFQKEYEAGSSEGAGFPPFNVASGEVMRDLYDSLGNKVCDVLEAVFPLLPKEQRTQ